MPDKRYLFLSSQSTSGALSQEKDGGHAMTTAPQHCSAILACVEGQEIEKSDE